MLGLRAKTVSFRTRSPRASACRPVYRSSHASTDPVSLKMIDVKVLGPSPAGTMCYAFIVVCEVGSNQSPQGWRIGLNCVPLLH
jgi:hypothetical protein